MRCVGAAWRDRPRWLATAPRLAREATVWALAPRRRAKMHTAHAKLHEFERTERTVWHGVSWPCMRTGRILSMMMSAGMCGVAALGFLSFFGIFFGMGF